MIGKFIFLGACRVPSKALPESQMPARHWEQIKKIDLPLP